LFFPSYFSPVPRFKQTVPIDDYVLDVLMRDLLGHDQKPAAFLVYLHLYGHAARSKWQPFNASARTIAEATGLSKSAVHAALMHLRRRQLIKTTAAHATATPRHRVLRHWRK
jgi:DNA-binding MarR family transcriptional regulator